MNALNKLISDDDFLVAEVIPSAEQTYVPETPIERGQLLRAIERLSELEDHWNGEGTLVPNPRALATAKKLIQIYPFGFMYPTSIYPGTDRSVVMEWVRDDIDGTIYLTIDPMSLGMVSLSSSGEVSDLGDFTLLDGDLFPPPSFKDRLPKYIK